MTRPPKRISSMPMSAAALQEEKKLLEKVAKLIALAGSPEAHEAKAAALTTCAIIRDHGFLVAPPHAASALAEHAQVTSRFVSLFENCKKRKGECR